MARCSVLMVHGYMQNAEIFSARTSNLRRKALKFAEYVFAESPLAASMVETNAAPTDSSHRENACAWYNPREVDVRPVNSTEYVGWEGPLQALREQAKEKGPFAGLLAFSQGGVPALMLLSEMRSEFRFAVFVSCFAPLDPAVVQQLKGLPIEIPTLHILGTSDPLVSAERSHELAAMFKDPVIVTHDGGHIMIPNKLADEVRGFLSHVDCYYSQ